MPLPCWSGITVSLYYTEYTDCSHMMSVQCYTEYTDCSHMMSVQCYTEYTDCSHMTVQCQSVCICPIITVM